MRPVLGALNQPRPHGIERHIAHRIHQMLLVERRRAEPALKQMAGLARAGVDEAGVEPAPPRQRQPQALAVLRRQDEMDVFGIWQ
jgi:hypothetical protein